MKNQIKLGRYFGIEIGLHVSWFIIAFLIIFSVAQDFRAHNPDWTNSAVWGTALVTGLLFFVTIIVHEMAHSLVAQARGIPVKAITLFALGGVSQIEKESEDAKTEFEIGIAGPLMSLVIGGGCLGLARALGWAGTPHQPALALLVWLGYINIGLAVFNLVPGFPLDGGRVLRAIIWWRTGDGASATRLAARVGHWIAMTLIFLGILEFFEGGGLNGLWLAFIGWFLNEACRATSMKAEWDAALAGVPVEGIMQRDSPSVPIDTSLDAFVHDFLLRTGAACFVVRDDGRNVGLLTAEDVKKAAKPEWPSTPVGRVMRRFEQLHTVPAGASAKTALESMMHDDVEQLAVVRDGHVSGIVSRGQILQLLHTRMDLRA
ncbi:MAG TPA: site-2 protease family protein [Elusimicrobiota bacterium]|nr:site-2 protease family protein [Elusimicrobiota bacterium]